MRKLKPLAYVGIVVAFAATCTGTERVGDVSAVVFGRITSTSGLVVPGASAIVEFLSDTIRQPPYPPECAGERLLPAFTQDLDAFGDYRVVLFGRAEVGRRVCVQVTGDPHGLYSDVGLRRAYGGWIELRSNGVARDSLRVDVRYTETP